MENEIAGKAAAAALQNSVYQLLRETFSNEYQFGFRYIRESGFEGEGIVRFSGRTYDRTCGCYDSESGVFTAQAKGVYVFCCEIPRASASGVSLEVNKLKVAEAKHTSENDIYSNAITLLSMVLLEPGYRVYVYSQNECNQLKPEKQKKESEKGEKTEKGEEEEQPRPMIFAGALVEEVESDELLNNLRRASV